jgi:hypothetical protein
MNTLIVHPQTQAQEKALKAVLEALDIAFENINTNKPEEICTLPSHVVETVRKSEAQIKNGEFQTYDQVKSILKNR